MATNLLQSGDKLTVTAPAAVSSGDGVQVGQIFGVASADAASGADVVIAVTGVYTLPKTSAQEWAVGDAIYWDSTAGEATTATGSPGNLFIGVATAAAANPSSTGSVRLNGSFPAS